MDTILAQLQLLTKASLNENPNASKDSDASASRYGRNDKDNSSKDKEKKITGFHPYRKTMKDKDKMLEDIISPIKTHCRRRG